jgi:vacuole morphology and inheritance protein 14
VSNTRSKLGRDDIKWQELLAHFRLVQFKHEKARRQALGSDDTFTDLMEPERLNNPPVMATNAPTSSASRNPLRRQATGAQTTTPSRTGALSPLNPHKRANGQSSLASAVASRFTGGAPVRSPSPVSSEEKSRGNRSLSLSRKT